VKRIMAVVLSIVALAAVVVGVRLSFGHHRVVTAPPPRTFPRKYVGIVSYNVPKFDQTCGCSPNVAVHYLHIGGSTNMGSVYSILDTGAVPLLELEPFGLSLASISSGSEDTWLANYARAVSSLHSPVIMSFAPEANGNWYSWGYPHVRPSVVVSAWRHVVTIFRQAGAHNVRWAWIVNVDFAGSENINLLWPGSSYVNILGIDGYFLAPASFEGFFGPTIVAMRAISSDPMLITETAAAPSAGKADALSEIAVGVAQYDLIGFIWFDVKQHGSVTRQNWSIDNDSAALALFRSDVKNLR
jgi:hypothetical protein